jgi:hypothetical protein
LLGGRGATNRFVKGIAGHERAPVRGRWRVSCVGAARAQFVRATWPTGCPGAVDEGYRAAPFALSIPLPPTSAPSALQRAQDAPSSRRLAPRSRTVLHSRPGVVRADKGHGLDSPGERSMQMRAPRPPTPASEPLSATAAPHAAAPARPYVTSMTMGPHSVCSHGPVSSSEASEACRRGRREVGPRAGRHPAARPCCAAGAGPTNASRGYGQRGCARQAGSRAWAGCTWSASQRTSRETRPLCSKAPLSRQPQPPADSVTASCAGRTGTGRCGPGHSTRQRRDIARQGGGSFMPWGPGRA